VFDRTENDFVGTFFQERFGAFAELKAFTKRLGKDGREGAMARSHCCLRGAPEEEQGGGVTQAEAAEDFRRMSRSSGWMEQSWASSRSI